MSPDGSNRCDCGTDGEQAAGTDCPGVTPDGFCPICTPAPRRMRRAVHVAMAAVLGLAATGYFVGMRGNERSVARATVRSVASTVADDLAEENRLNAARPAVPYRQMDAIARGVNGEWTNHLGKLVDRTPGLFDPVHLDPAAKEAALQRRASRRAYDGAPPTVPHKIDQMSAASCLACHGQGLRVAELMAPKLSHARYTSCTQCHAEADNRAYPAGGELAPNTFIGAASPLSGDRAWQGAPPVMPHGLNMRQDCTSCHGVNGHAPLRSTHPWRQSCTQCHAPSATLNQQPFVAGPFPGESAEAPR